MSLVSKKRWDSVYIYKTINTRIWDKQYSVRRTQCLCIIFILVFENLSRGLEKIAVVYACSNVLYYLFNRGKEKFFCTWATLFREAEKDLFYNDSMVALFDGLQSLAVWMCHLFCIMFKTLTTKQVLLMDPLSHVLMYFIKGCLEYTWHITFELVWLSWCVKFKKLGQLDSLVICCTLAKATS